MNIHNEIEQKLTAYYFGELAAEDEQTVREHLATCAQCQKTFSQLNSVVKTLKHDLVDDEVPIKLLNRKQRQQIFAAADSIDGDTSKTIAQNNSEPEQKDDTFSPEQRSEFTVMNWFRAHRRTLLSTAAGLVITAIIWSLVLSRSLDSRKFVQDIAQESKESAHSFIEVDGHMPKNDISHRLEKEEQLSIAKENKSLSEFSISDKQGYDDGDSRLSRKRVSDFRSDGSSHEENENWIQTPAEDSWNNVSKSSVKQIELEKGEILHDEKSSVRKVRKKTSKALKNESAGDPGQSQIFGGDLNQQDPNRQLLEEKRGADLKTDPKRSSGTFSSSLTTFKSMKSTGFQSVEVDDKEAVNGSAKNLTQIQGFRGNYFLEQTRKEPAERQERDLLDGHVGEISSTAEFDSSEGTGGLKKLEGSLSQPPLPAPKPVLNTEDVLFLDTMALDEEHAEEFLGEEDEIGEFEAEEVSPSTDKEVEGLTRGERTASLEAKIGQKGNNKADDDFKPFNADEELARPIPPKNAPISKKRSSRQEKSIMSSGVAQFDNLTAGTHKIKTKSMTKGRPPQEKFDLSNELLHALKTRSLTDQGDIKKSLIELGIDFSNKSTYTLDEDDQQLVIIDPSESEKKDVGQLLHSFQAQIDANQAQSTLNSPTMVETRIDPVSTFSIDVDTASYTAARKDILNGNQPDPFSIRQEEFINYFDYKYPTPKSRTFAIYTDYAPSPFKKNKYLLRVAIQGKRPGSDTKRPSAFTFVIDTSGSMAEPNRLPMVQQQLPNLLDQMRPHDRVSVISTDLKPRLVLDQVTADEKDTIIQTVNRLQAKGGTNLEEGLVAAYNHVEQNYVGGAYNRVVLFSDGVANLGEVNGENIRKRVEHARKLGITFTAVGVGRGLYNDVLLETLANKGDGNYLFVDSDKEAKRAFVDNFAANFSVIARDVKIQVEFNPKKVLRYRLIGYDNRRLQKDDFRNDAIDAGEVGAGQSVTALYEIELKENVPEDICEVRLRFKDPDTYNVYEFNRKCDTDNKSAQFKESDWSFRLAVLTSEFAEYLRYGPNAKGVFPDDMLKELRPLVRELHSDPTITELQHLIMRLNK